MTTNADWFLAIASDEIDALERLFGEGIMVSSEPSPHFRHAAVATVFSVFAAECALTELIWVRVFLLPDD